MTTDFLSGKHVLTIDDSVTIRNFLTRSLTPKGAIVEGAEDGESGLARHAQQKFDLVFLDLLLPDMGGIEVLQAIRQREQDSVVVMLTGAGAIKSATTAMQYGADGYIQKQEIAGGDPNEFLYAISQAVAHRQGMLARQQLDALRADFYSMVTHDLRNPMTVVLASLELLMASKLMLDANQAELMQLAGSASQKTLRLINDYLDFASMDAGYLKPERSSQDLRQVVAASVKIGSLLARMKQVALDASLPDREVVADVDAEKLGQAFDNLVSNAIKYTPAGGQVQVTLTTADDAAQFRIQDSGVGIPPSEIPSLFTKYHRVPGQGTRGVKGTGLGLLIVKEIVDAHGGTVHAESEGPGRGSSFVVTLPLRA